METTTPEQPTPAPRRLLRSSTDRVLGGVCGGLARYFEIDPVLVRVVAVVLALFGGLAIPVYLACWLLIPSDDAADTPRSGGQRAAIAAGIVVLAIAAGSLLPFHHGFFGWGGWFFVPLAWLALAGLVVWWLVTGRGIGDPPTQASDIARRAAFGVGIIILCGLLAVGGAWAAATGGGAAVAALVVASGIALIAGAFVGGARWLILPALSLAIPLAVVTAAGIHVSGGVGDHEYRPGSAATVRSSYDLGVGRLVVDLRQAHLAPGDHPVKLDVGVGQAMLLVPRNVCVSTNGKAGVGAVQVFDHTDGGIDVDHQDDRTAPLGTPRVLLDAHVGIGAVEVHHYDSGQAFGEPDRLDAVGNAACVGGAA
jgi:phage shock protein PspC (stress-responsive transcriptional regulator)